MALAEAPPVIDHVSVTSSLDALDELGFSLTPTKGSGGRHGRVMLDRTYLEVTLESEDSSVFGRGWFLRPPDIQAAPARLRQHGIPATDPTLYEGHDGSWLDVEMDVPALARVLPTLTCRLHVADCWPPPLREPHPNQATGIAELHLRTHDPTALIDVLETLGGDAKDRSHVAFNGGAVVAIAAADKHPAGLAGLVVARAGKAPMYIELAALS